MIAMRNSEEIQFRQNFHCSHCCITNSDLWTLANFSLFQVCPWTLFLTMSLTLLKGLMPHVPQMLPLLVTDPEMRSRAEETFMSPEFQENIEQYFVENIKVSLHSKVIPITRTAEKKSESPKLA